MARPEPRKRAAALRYEPPKHAAPHIVAQGVGVVADRIIALAREHGVHIHEDPVLVEMLALLDIGDEIPEQLYKAVAEILAFIYGIDHGHSARTARPGQRGLT
jgi:flagellar biosynthesis protein